MLTASIFILTIFWEKKYRMKKNARHMTSIINHEQNKMLAVSIFILVILLYIIRGTPKRIP